ncbi:unnamed protein product [Lepeophtheirus salmonis]|uniref:(salmon louse) hypothetical protein n=1 Tax=Lepeophtheirus salmonis TaxID=72036 RepID=A0A7R8H966_LEPSM|nr:unnamed protein product [Lepeophtheirus salmonis]CAF2951546.1 unnamed protein product [Lepeophtheirus salmonis]
MYTYYVDRYLNRITRLMLNSSCISNEELDISLVEENIDSVETDESNFSTGVKDVHRFVKQYREVNLYDVPPEDKVLELIHTIDFTKPGNNKFSKLGVLLDKFFILTKNGIPFRDIREAIPLGVPLSDALIAMHKLTFQRKVKNEDLKFVDKVLSFVKDNPTFAVTKAVELATKFGFITRHTSKSIHNNFLPIFESDVASEYVDTENESYHNFLKSSKNPSVDKVVEFLKKESEWNAQMFFDSMENSDYKNGILKMLSSLIAKIIAQGEILFGSPSERGLLLMNGLLLSQGIPAYNTKRPIYSLGVAVNKAIKLFTTFRFDVSPYISTIEDLFKELTESAQWKLFFSLDEVQRVTAIQRFIDDEVTEHIGDLWSMHSYMSKNNKWNCIEIFLCLEAQKAKKSGKETQQIGASVMSMVAAWIWNENSINADFWKYYEAVWNGISLECDTKYPMKDLKDCVALSWQEEGSKNKMELNFDKVEL